MTQEKRIMPPKLALLLCFIFCFVVYIKDSKQDLEISPAIWIPVLWMMRCASRSLSYWLSPGGYHADIIGSPHDRIFFTILIVAGLVVLARRKVNWPEILKSNAWLLVLFVYMGVSIFWADFMGLSFKRWIRTAGDLIMVLIVLTEVYPLKAVDKLCRSCFLLLIPLSVVFVKYFPHLGRSQHKHWGSDWWIGVATHKNTLGQLCLLAGLYFLWHIVQNRGKEKISIDILYLLMVAYLINGGGHSRSATCILLIIVAPVLYFILERARFEPSRIWGIIVGVILTASVFQFVCIVFESSIYQLTVTLFGKDSTLAGRTDLWRDVIALGMENPIIGAGHGGFWTPAITQYLKEIYTWGPGQAHNGYIEVFLNLGLVGLLIFGFIIVSTMRNAIRQCHFDFEYGRIRLILLVIVLMHNYTESSFARPTHLIWFTFLLVAVNVWHVSPLRSKEPGKSL